MTEAQVLEELNCIRNKDEQIKRKLDNIALLKEQAYSISALYYGEKVRSSSKNSKIENNIIKIEEAEKKLSKYERDISIRQADMLSYIQELPENECSVMIMFYYKNMKAQDIAETLGYSEKNIWVLKKAAIEKLAELTE